MIEQVIKTLQPNEINLLETRKVLLSGNLDNSANNYIFSGCSIF